MRIPAGLVATALASSPTALRAEASRIATARELAIQGIELIESDDCTRGAPLVEQAERLHHAVVHLQYLARCQARTGRLVAATELWRRLLREPIPQNATPAVHAAVSEARGELAKTLPRLARTTLDIQRRYDGLELRLDGALLPAPVAGASHVLDPGKHRLTATAPSFAPFTAEWILEEGAATTVVIRLSPKSSSPDRTPSTSSPSDSPLPTIGWITAAAGGASLIAGTVTLLSRNNRRRNLRDQCPDGTCSPPAIDRSEFEQEKASIERLTTLSNLLFAAGGVLVGTGVTLVIVGSSPNDHDFSKSALRLRLTPGAMTALGTF